LFPRKYIVCVGGGSFSTPFSKTAAAAASATCCNIEDIAVFINLLSFILVDVVGLNYRRIRTSSSGFVYEAVTVSLYCVINRPRLSPTLRPSPNA